MITKAQLIPLKPNSDTPENDKAIEADFNPSSLRVGFRSAGQSARSQAGIGSQTQTVTSSTEQATTYSGSLSIELLFDRTQSGEDVRQTTLKILALLRPGPDDSARGANDPTTKPRVLFQYGAFLFRGTIDSMDETLDYFSESGVPLRATVSLSMTQVDPRRLDESAAKGSAAAGITAGFSASLSASASVSAGASFSAGASASFGASAGLSAGAGVGTQPLTLAASGDSLQGIALRAGADWRAVATANNITNPRKLQGGVVLNLRAR